MDDVCAPVPEEPVVDVAGCELLALPVVEPGIVPAVAVCEPEADTGTLSPESGDDPDAAVLPAVVKPTPADDVLAT